MAIGSTFLWWDWGTKPRVSTAQHSKDTPEGVGVKGVHSS